MVLFSHIAPSCKLLPFVRRLMAPLLLVCALALAVPMQAQERKAVVPQARVLFVLDASQSMFGLWQKQQKMVVARRILSHWADSLSRLGDVQMALRVYGDQYTVPPQVCDDSRLLVPFAPHNATAVKKALTKLQPKGTTPIAFALQSAAHDFPAADGSKHILVLITDGIEECQGDPCAASAALQRKGISMKPFVVGLGRTQHSALDCIGTFLPSATPDDLPQAFSAIVSSVLNQTTAQISLLDEQLRPTTTNVGVHLYAYHKPKQNQAFVHTLNAMGLPDTILLDAALRYKVVANTLPAVVKDSVQLHAAQHNTIALEAAVGTLAITFGNRQSADYAIPAIVQSVGDGSIINVQYVGQTESYLADYYAVEVLSLPRVRMDSVLLSPRHTTSIQLPMPGILNIQKQGYTHGSIFVKKNDEWEMVYHLRDLINYAESLYLLPGAYKIMYRQKASFSQQDSKIKYFEIKPKKTTHIAL